MRSTWASRLLARVGDVHRRVDVAHDLPMLLVGDLEEISTGGSLFLNSFSSAEPSQGKVKKASSIFFASSGLRLWTVP